MILTFTFFFHWGLDPVCKSEEISQHESFVHYLIVFLIAFPLANTHVNLAEAEPQLVYSCLGPLCWSWGHFLAALRGHFMGRATARQQDAVQCLTSSMATSALGGKPGKMHLKYPLEFRDSVRNAVLRNFFCRKGLSQSYSCPENFSLKPELS